MPHTLNTHTIGMAQDARAASANVATPARMAATRSPYAAGIANAGESEGDTTPGIKKLSPTNRNVSGITNGMRASVRRMTRSRGQMYTFVTMAKPRKLIKMLSPNNASLLIGSPPLMCRLTSKYADPPRQDEGPSLKPLVLGYACFVPERGQNIHLPL